jgi:hypothetical protein
MPSDDPSLSRLVGPIRKTDEGPERGYPAAAVVTGWKERGRPGSRPPCGRLIVSYNG